MFRGLSESKDFPRGKRIPERSTTHRQHHYDMGFPPWQQSFQSATQVLHDKKPLNWRRNVHEGRNQSHFTLEGEYQDRQRAGNLYLSEKHDKYKDFGAKREKGKIVANQGKSSIVMGDDNPSYTSENHLNFYDKSRVQLPEVVFKPKPERYDIITNNEVPRERKEKACVFEYWVESQQKKRVSANYSEIPRDGEIVDIITGRRRKLLR